MKQVLHDPKLKYAITPKIDHSVEGTSSRFTIGEAFDPISGAIYFKQGTVVPKMLILMFEPKSDDKAEVTIVDLIEEEK